jgi:hypothetical protein
VDPLEWRLGGYLDERDRLTCQRLPARDLVDACGGHEPAGELFAARRRGRIREPLEDCRKLERVKCVCVHTASVTIQRGDLN